MKINKCLAAIALSVGAIQSAQSSPWPTGVADNVTVSTGQRVYIPVLTNDSGEGLSITEVNTRTVQLGSVEMNASKTAVYYKSKAGFSGDDSFWYAFKDNLGRTNATQVFLKVISFNSNDGGGSSQNFSGWPIANVDTVTTQKNTSISIPVLDNDVGDQLTLTTVNDWTVNGGRARIQGDNVIYDPKANYTGQDSFWYNFIDARGRKNATQVKVTISDSTDNGGGIVDAKLISMHSDFLKEQHFIWGEPGGTVSRKATQYTAAGSYKIYVNDGFALKNNQLISYLSTDGQYYTVATSQSFGNTINLKAALPAPIAQWSNIWNFYRDGSHPNTNGFRSLADFALRNNDASSLNYGKHVLLGDSWFSSEGIKERLAVKLPNAQIIGKGIGGHTAADMLARFDRDVASQNPDVVWLIAGTNDYYQGVSVTAYKANMKALIEKINGIGAKAMVFDSSVAPLMSGGNTVLLEKSHQYSKALADLF